MALFFHAEFQSDIETLTCDLWVTGDVQADDKDNKKSANKSDAARELISFMRNHYKNKVEPAKTFDEFYHAIYELIE